MKKLYDEDSYIAEFSAQVISCEECKKGYRVALDRTAFFPTAGGQECDGGILDGQEVIAVEIYNEMIYHIVKNPIQTGKTVEGKIFWQERFRKMQHHSAEHIVSGIVHKKFGFENTGFHLSNKEVTMDYGGVITAQQLTEIEYEANRAVWKNLKITAYYPEESELDSMEYRSKLELTENVRIVEIDGVDTCACCAPHVKMTGEIGLIKLTDMMHHRGGVRIRMICGGDALADYQAKHDSTVKISTMLAVKQEEIPDGVQRVLDEISQLKQKKGALLKMLALAELAAIEETDKNICIFSDEPEIIKTFADLGKDKCKGVCAVLSGDEEKGYNYVICSKNVDLTKISKYINEVLSGRGGGRDMLSGRFGAKKTEIQKFFAENEF